MNKFDKNCVYFGFEGADVLNGLIGKQVVLEDDIAVLRILIEQGVEFPAILKEIDLTSEEQRFIPQEGAGFKYCYYDPNAVFTIPTVTYKHLAHWLAQGRGQILDGMRIKTTLEYDTFMEDDNVPEGIKVRAWEHDEWHRPTKDYLEQ